MLLYSGKLVGRQEEQAHSLPVGKSSLIYFQDSLSALEGFFRPYSSFNISFAWVNLYRSGAARSPAGSRMFVNSRVDSLPCFGDSKLPLKFSSCSFQWSFRLDPVTTLILGSDFLRNFSLLVGVAGGRVLRCRFSGCYIHGILTHLFQHLSPKVCSQGDQEVVGWLSWRPLFQALLFIEEAFLEWPDKPR